jgi:septal ring factor EnvC (AmiA/AmiB activator)
MLFAMATLLPSSLPAQSDLAPGQSLAQQRAAFARAMAQANDARRRSEQLEGRATLATAAADRTRDHAAVLAARVQQSEADLRAGEARIAIIAAQQRAQAHRLALRQGPIARLTAALQQLARRSPVLALVEPGSIADAVHRRIVLSQMLPIVMARTRDLRAELTRSAALRRSEEQAAAALRKTGADLREQRAALAEAEQRLRVAARQLHETASAETERSLAMGEEARDIGDLMGRIKEAGAVREALLRLPGPTLRPAMPGATALPTATAEPAFATGSRPPPYRLPVIGDVVAGFGEVSTSGVRSRGLAIATASSATVVAPAAGRVAFAGPFRGYGRILIIEHGGGWTTLIANLGSLSASIGDELRQGDPVGSAPNVSRPQIMLELRQGETPVDIVGLLR